MCYVIDSRQILANALKARGRITVQEYRWERVANRVVDYYYSLMAKPA